MNDIALRADHVTKRFRIPLEHGPTLQSRFSHPVSSSRRRDLLALDDVSFEVRRGETIGIAGPNGCGKSTLLKLLCGIYQPDAGRIEANGFISPFLELGVGFKQEMTARENIFLGGAVLGLLHRQLAALVDDVLDFAELREFADQKLRNFSSGMAVRLAFSVAMLADADILLMDEVLAVGDARFQEKCFDVFDHYKRQGRTVLLVSHDLEALQAHCDRVLLFDAGRIIRGGHADEVISDYRRMVAAKSSREGSAVADLEGLPAGRRSGTGQMQVTSLRLLSEGGQAMHSFMTGESLLLEIGYSGQSRVDAWTAQAEFHSAEGHVVASSSTTVSRLASPDGQWNDGDWLTYSIDGLALLSGSYTVTVTIGDEHGRQVFDRLEGVLEFRVSDPAARPGIVALDGSWHPGKVTDPSLVGR